jgi:hypothetical protein
MCYNADMTFDEFRERDTQVAPGESHGWIQWKGTNVCIDLRCACGHHGHFDGEFFYSYECPACHRKFAVGMTIKLIEVPKGEAYTHDDYKTTEFPEEFCDCDACEAAR